MSDYIDREELLKYREEMWQDRCDHMVVRVTNIMCLPKADVVPVVRCKDCTEWDKDECECSHWYGFKENDFCSYGERKD